MSYTYDRLNGAAADVAELEYIAALHQTQHSETKRNWINASIQAIDVKNFLLSRHGIQLTEDENKRIMSGIGGMGDADGDDGNNEEDECIDLTEREWRIFFAFI